MRRSLAAVCGFVFVAAALLCLSCSREQPFAGADVNTVAERILATQEELPPQQKYDEDSPTFANLLERLYDIDPGGVSSGCLYLSDGPRAEEVIVLKFSDPETARKGKESLDEYALDRYATFAGYAPQMSNMIERRMLVQQGNVVAMAILADPDAAFTVLSEQFSVEPASSSPTGMSVASQSEAPIPTPVPTEKIQLYDHDLVVAALKNENPHGLSGQNEAVYWVVREFLNARISDDMTAYEKELAAHDWIVENVKYDPGAMTRNLGKMEESPFNDTPYGALVLGKAKCYGYSSSFQLLMDVLEIPCETIDGASVTWERPHSWNAVNLDGQWYFVDVTWDAPVDAPPHHNYFNQTAAYYSAHGPHLWDEAASPLIAETPYEPQ